VILTARLAFNQVKTAHLALTFRWEDRCTFLNHLLVAVSFAQLVVISIPISQYVIFAILHVESAGALLIVNAVDAVTLQILPIQLSFTI